MNNHVILFSSQHLQNFVTNEHLWQDRKLQAKLMRSSGIAPEDAASTSTTFYYSAFILNQVFNQILYTTKWSCLRQEKQKTKHFLGQLSSLVSLTHNSTLYKVSSWYKL